MLAALAATTALAAGACSDADTAPVPSAEFADPAPAPNHVRPEARGESEELDGDPQSPAERPPTPAGSDAAPSADAAETSGDQARPPSPPTGTLQRVRGNWELSNHIERFYGLRSASAQRSYTLVRDAVLAHNGVERLEAPTELRFPDYPDLARTIGLPEALIPALEAILAGHCSSTPTYVEHPMLPAAQLIRRSAYAAQLEPLAKDLAKHRCRAPVPPAQRDSVEYSKRSVSARRTVYRTAGRLLHWARGQRPG